jgi:phosphoribosylformylglycinamidine (FGAM) synthase-like enzyme
VGVHLAQVSLAAGLGVDVDVSSVTPGLPAHAALYSESAGRFLVSIAPKDRDRFESLFRLKSLGREQSIFSLLGEVRSDQTFLVKRQGRTLLEMPLSDLKAAWQRRFGGLV